MSIQSRRSRLAWVVVAAAAACCLLAAGCRKSAPKAEPGQAHADAGKPRGIPIRLTLDAAQKKAVEKLVTSLKNGRFPNEAVRDKAKAKLFLYLAATSQRPEVIMAALQAMKMAFTSSEAYKKKEYAGQDYASVVAAHLQSKDPKIQGYALEAAPHAVSGKQPDAPVVAALVKVATSHPSIPARAEAIDRLRLVRNFQQNQQIAEAFLQALDSDQAYVVSKALFGLRLRATGLVMRSKFLERARSLMRHPDPGVRGRAAELAGRLGAGKPPVVQEVTALLRDQHPFTRSAACSALAHMGDLASVHEIVKLVDDTEKNTYDIRGFQTPTGRAGWVHHDGSAWSRVQDAAIRALERLSMRTATRFKADRVESKDVERSLAKNARAAKAWYAKVKAKLPKPEASEAAAEPEVDTRAGAASASRPRALPRAPASAEPDP